MAAASGPVPPNQWIIHHEKLTQYLICYDDDGGSGTHTPASRSSVGADDLRSSLASASPDLSGEELIRRIEGARATAKARGR
jgi:hypothetical protein